MRRHRALQPLAVVAVVFAVVTGGWVAGGATQHPPVRVSDRVVVPLALGWVAIGTTSPGAFHGTRLTNGTATVDVEVAEFADAAALMSAYVRGPLSTRTVGPILAKDVRRVRLDAGRRALRVLYTAVDKRDGYAIEGEITAFVGPSSAGVVFDGWAERGSYALERDGVVQMASDTEVSP